MNKNNTHYYAYCGYGWATGLTSEAAVAKLARIVGARTIARHRQQGAELTVTVLHVDAPITASYSIENYRPAGVPILGSSTYALLNARGATRPSSDD